MRQDGVNIFFQNGMKSNFSTALEVGKLISEGTGRGTGLIVNNSEDLWKDIVEYMPDRLVLRDALNGEVYTQIDDYNKEVDEGLHITSMAGTWMSVVEGFAGVRVNEKGLFVNPILPEGWNEYAFNMLYRENPLRICVKPNSIELINKSDNSIKAHLFGKEILIESKQTISKSC